MLPVIQKPDRGAPCNGCGWCCQQEVCGMALEAWPEAEAPCPFLRSDGSRYWCRVIEEADKANVAFGSHMKLRLGIGAGCLA
jgi:hypothetical protein